MEPIMRHCLLWLITWLGLAEAPLWAQTKQPPAEDPVHNELRAVRDGVVDAFNKRDIDRLLGYMHPNVVLTWQNAEVTRGRDGARAYYQRMLLDKNSVVKSLTVNVIVDELAIIYGGNTAVAFGALGDDYKLRDGMAFNLNSRWSATLVKEGDRWLIASAHGSANVFDNAVMSLALKKIMYWAGGGGLAVGLVVGILGTLLAKRRKRPA
jgi:ketosteroid isomerase-like protein